MVYLIALLPALGWGLMPVIAKVMRGTPREQLLGTTIAALSVSMIVNCVFNITYEIEPVIISFISGFFWSIGQYFQFLVINKADVSKVMPVSNGTQLLFTTLCAGIFLGEWQSNSQAILTLTCLVVLTFSIYLVTKSDKISDKLSKKSILILCLSSLCLMIYVSITSYFKVSGIQVFLPQALGMFGGSMLFSVIKTNHSTPSKLNLKKISKNIFTGLSWVLANMSLFYVSRHLGVGFTYSISQLCVILSSYFGVALLKESKSLKEIKFLNVGSLLYIINIIIMSTQK